MVKFNDDKEIVEAVKEGLKNTGGYCPCRLERTEETKCMCKDDLPKLCGRSSRRI